jgi:hypothetical protein
MNANERTHRGEVGAGITFCAGNSGTHPSTPCVLIHPLPLAVSLKRAIVFAGAEGYVPRDHARRLLALLQLREV